MRPSGAKAMVVGPVRLVTTASLTNPGGKTVAAFTGLKSTAKPVNTKMANMKAADIRDMHFSLAITVCFRVTESKDYNL